MEQQQISTDMFVESLRRMAAVDVAANAMWSSDVLLRDDLARRRKRPKWELRWLCVFPQVPVQTLEGLTQAVLVYKTANVRSHLHHLNADLLCLKRLLSAQAATPLQALPVYSALVEVHRKFEPSQQPPRFVFEVDSRGDSAAQQWQLTFAVESAEAVEGWSLYWSEVSDGLSNAGARHRAHHSIESRLVEAEPVRLEGMLTLRLPKSKKNVPRWCIVRGPLLQFYASEAEARRVEASGQILKHHADVHGGKGVEAQEASVHLDHAIVSPVASKLGTGSREFEIVSGSKSWQLQTSSEEEHDTWGTVLQRLAGGDSASLDVNHARGGMKAASQASPLSDVTTVRAEVGQRHLGLSFARCFSERLGTEYFSVQSIRRPDTVAAAAEPQLKLGMVLQSVNGVALMLTLAQCGGRGDRAFELLQQQLAQRPLTLTFVRTPNQLRMDMDAAKAAHSSVQTKSAAVVVTPVLGSGNERRLLSGTSTLSTSGSNGSSPLKHVEVSQDPSLGGKRVPFVSALGNHSANGDAPSPAGQPRHSQSSAAASDTTPIRHARAHYGPWWSRMSRHQQQAAVAAAAQELALVEMGVIEPHRFEFHHGEEKIQEAAAEETAQASKYAELVKPSGSPWAVPPTPSHAGLAKQSTTAQPQHLTLKIASVPGPERATDRMPATREYMQGVADASSMQVPKHTTDLRGAPMESSPATTGTDGRAEFWDGVRDARMQAAKSQLLSPAQRTATRPAPSAPGSPHQLRSVGDAAALGLQFSGTEYDI